MRILIVSNKSSAKSMDSQMMAICYLSSLGIDAMAIDVGELPAPDAVFDPSSQQGIIGKLGESFDMAIVFAGDGTILRTGRLAFLYDCPILGINCGHMGFLANDSERGVVPLIAQALAGEMQRELRSNLECEVICLGDAQSTSPIRGGSARGARRYFAVNEIVLGRGESGRLVLSDVHISGDKVFYARGDGIIVATATGSTAYGLAAGGPIIYPAFRGMEVVPLAPHMLSARTIIADAHDVVEIDATVGDSVQDLVVYADGDTITFERPIERVLVKVGAHPTVLLNGSGKGFYAKVADAFYR